MPGISRRSILRGGVLAATAVVTTRLAGPATAFAAPASQFAVAYNELDITPHVPDWPSLWMGGYGWDPRGASASAPPPAHPLRAHCIAIHDNGSVNVLLRVDVVSIPRDVHQELRRRVCDELGLVGSSDFMVVASHTHSGPFIGDTHPDPRVVLNVSDADVDAVNGSTSVFMDLLTDLVERTVAETPIPATLHFAEGSAETGRNRVGLDLVLTDVPVVAVRDAQDGGLLAVLFGCATHPVSCGRAPFEFHSDFVGVAAEIIEQELGAMALFFQGTAGDQDPLPLPTGELGQILASAVIDTIDQGDFTDVEGPITTELTEIALPFAVDTTDDGVRAELRSKFESRLDGHLGQAEVRHARLMLGQLDAGTLPASIPMPLQCWKMGGLTILGLAHEVVSDYHVLIDAAAQDLGVGNLWIMGYANETQCYVPSDRILWAGGDLHIGYEAGWNDDPWIAGYGSSMLSYGWPSPLNASAPGSDPASPDSTEALVLAACEGLLG
jgi:hypothetical protein